MEQQALSQAQIMVMLRDNGFRLTGPRRAIVDRILVLDRAFTADDLHRELQQTNPGIGRATVFRTLDVLASLDILDRVHRPDGCHTYIIAQSGNRHYHHLICSDCGVVVPFEGCNIESIYDDLSSRSDFTISGHLVEVFGVCGVCRN